MIPGITRHHKIRPPFHELKGMRDGWACLREHFARDGVPQVELDIDELRYLSMGFQVTFWFLDPREGYRVVERCVLANEKAAFSPRICFPTVVDRSVLIVSIIEEKEPGRQ